MAYKKFTEEEKAAYKERKKAETEEMYNRIEEGISQVFTSDGYKEYLDFYSQFHSYSINNTMLIMLSNPNATKVASFSKWKELGRSVKKGEKGISVFAPVLAKGGEMVEKPMKDEYGNPIYNEDGTEKTEKVKVVTGEKVVKGFKKVSVFDVSQTAGEPLPELVKPLVGDVDEDIRQTVEKVLKEATGIGYTLEENDRTYGRYNKVENKIYLSNNLSGKDFVSTYIHESAHCLMHSNPDEKLSKEDKEIQAESVAYIVSTHLGIDTSEQSFPYIAGYAASKDTKELKNILYGTQKTASALIKRFDEAFEEMYERKRIQEQEKTADIEDMLDVKDHSLNYCIVTLDDTEEFVTGAYIDEEEIHDLKEFQRYALKTGADEIDVEYSMYNIGNGESVNANDKEIEIIRNNLDSVLEKSDVMETDSFTVEPLTDEYEVYDETPQTESEKAAESTTKTEDFSDIIGVNKIESEHDDYHDAYCWTYFNPEGFDGKGQFVQMWFDEDLMRAALCDRRQITGQKGAELGNKAFVDCIYNNARTNLCDNDGDKAFGEWLEDFRNGECGHVIKGVDETSKEFYDKIVDVFASDSPAVSEAFRKERLNGYQPIKTDVAVAMWENGFSVVDNDGFEIAPFSESGYGMFTNVKDYVFYGDSNDYYRQQLFDEIAENVDSISENSEFDLSNCYEDYEWYSYNECQNAFLNVQELLRTGETEPLENYLKDVSRHYSSENLQDDEVVQNISGAIQAVKELKQDVERTRSLEREKSESQEATPIMSNAGGRGR